MFLLSIFSIFLRTYKHLQLLLFCVGSYCRYVYFIEFYDRNNTIRQRNRSIIFKQLSTGAQHTVESWLVIKFKRISTYQVLISSGVYWTLGIGCPLKKYHQGLCVESKIRNNSKNKKKIIQNIPIIILYRIMLQQKVLGYNNLLHCNRFFYLGTVKINFSFNIYAIEMILTICKSSLCLQILRASSDTLDL